MITSIYGSSYKGTHLRMCHEQAIALSPENFHDIDIVQRTCYFNLNAEEQEGENKVGLHSEDAQPRSRTTD
jgi:hypothetical protein